MPLSLAEEARQVVGIDPIDRFGQAGVRLARERRATHLQFALADGMALPFVDGAFDLVLSHAVIEHVSNATLYLRECARVLAPDGRIYLSTAPYLSFAGAHLPRLKVPIPLHLLVGRSAAFATFQFLARHATWALKEPAHENSFIKLARQGQVKQDDLLEKVRVVSLRRQISTAGLRIGARSCTSRGRFDVCRRRLAGRSVTALWCRTFSSATWSTSWLTRTRALAAESPFPPVKRRHAPLGPEASARWRR